MRDDNFKLLVTIIEAAQRASLVCSADAAAAEAEGLEEKRCLDLAAAKANITLANELCETVQMNYGLQLFEDA